MHEFIKRRTKHRWSKQSKLGLKIRPFDLSKLHKKMPENPPPNNSSIEAKALKVIHEKSFCIPQALTSDRGYNKSTEKAITHILEKWPLEAATKIIPLIDNLEIIPFQSYHIRLDNKETHFEHSLLKKESEIGVTESGLTNIFFEKLLNEVQVRNLPRVEEILQRFYQVGERPRVTTSLLKVYTHEATSLLKKSKIISDRPNIGVNDYPNSIFIIKITGKNQMLIFTPIRESALERGAFNHAAMLFSFSTSENIDKFADFILEKNCLDLDAIFSLLFSKDLTPNIQNENRNKIFYVNEEQKKTFQIEARLEEFSVGDGVVVKRL